MSTPTTTHGFSTPIEQLPDNIEFLRSELKKEVINLYQGHWHLLNKPLIDTDNLDRYLKARNYDIGKSAKMLHQSLKWRDEFKPDILSAREFEKHFKNGANYLAGYDKYGRPITVTKVRLDRNESVNTKFKLMIYQVERCIRFMKNTDATTMVWLIDLRDFPSHLMYPAHTSLTRSVLNTLSNHYPERLGASVAINAPSIFQAFWKICSVFIDSNTSQKIYFFKSRELYKLQEFIDMNILEKDWGGNREFIYDHKVFWEKLMAEEDEWLPRNIEILNQAHVIDNDYNKTARAGFKGSHSTGSYSDLDIDGPILNEVNKNDTGQYTNVQDIHEEQDFVRNSPAMGDKNNSGSFPLKDQSV